MIMANNKKRVILLIAGIVLIVILAVLLLYSQKKQPISSVNLSQPEQITQNRISLPIPVGAYFSYSAEHQPSGIIDTEQKDKLSFDKDNHYLAQLVWFGEDGFLEYQVKNPLSIKDKPKALRLFLEACSETWGYSLDNKTDISFSVNGVKIGQYLIPSDFGGKRGKYTPEWWPTANTQYGEPIFVEVRQDGTYVANSYSDDWKNNKTPELNFQRISDVKIGDLPLNKKLITLRVSVDKDAQYKGGLNLFGDEFGNYPKTLTLGIEYDGDKIYQPTIGEIIDKPEEFENKKVILAVHPGGWGCPSKKSTAIPEGFSRSATMIYDDTGCLYGNGDILVGKILSPEVHTINVPGEETIVVEGKIKLDKNNIPFLLPLNI